MMNARDVVTEMEKQIARLMKPFGYKRDKVFYDLYFYYRKGLIETGRATAEEILQSITLL